jgi:hypothetical protein
MSWLCEGYQRIHGLMFRKRYDLCVQPNKYRLYLPCSDIVPATTTPWPATTSSEWPATTSTEWIDESFTFILEATGTGLGVSTLSMQATADIILTLDGTARFYSDAAGTLNESTTWNLIAGALRTIYVRCPSGTSNMVVNDATKLIGLGGPGLYNYGWLSFANAARIIFTPVSSVLESIVIIGNSIISGALPDTLKLFMASTNDLHWDYTGPVPDGMTMLALSGANINWTYAGALPAGLTILSLGESCYWTYNGALPVGLTLLQFQCPTTNAVAWTYNGALPIGLTYVMLNSANISWTYNGALPVGLTSISFSKTGVFWTYNGTLPNGLTSLYIDSSSADWTGLDVGDLGNITTFNLSDYRQAKMSSADMITLLTQLTNRAGTMPVLVIIRDYIDYASPPAGVVTAVNTLKATKGVITVNLGS